MKSIFRLTCFFFLTTLVAGCSGGSEENDQGTDGETMSEMASAVRHLYAFTDGLSYGLMTSTGKVVMAPQFPELGPWREGRMWYREINKYGYLNGDGETAIPAIYDRAFSFSDGVAMVWKDGKAGYIDSTGAWAFAQKFEKGSGSFYGGLAHVLSGGKFGIINKKGEWVAQPIYDEILSRPMDETAELSSGLAFGQGPADSALFAIGKRKGEVFLMDRDGNTTPLRPDRQYYSPENGAIEFVEKLKIGYTFTNGSGDIAPIYSDGRSYSEGMAPVSDGKNWFYIDTGGKRVSRAGYKTAYPFKDGLARVQCPDGKWGWLGRDGKLSLECRWAWAEDFAGALARVSDQPSGKPWYFINRKGERADAKNELPNL